MISFKPIYRKRPAGSGIAAVLVTWGLWAAFNSEAATWTVEWNPTQPENQIGAVAEIAASGDTILVGPGTYYEHIPLEAKSLAFISTDGKENTILDGSAIFDGREKSIIYMVGGDAEDLMVEGFTLRNGAGAPEEYGEIAGGAISWWSRGLGGSARILDCRFHDNYLLDDSSGRGGAVFLTDISTVEMIGCEFEDNDADWNGGSASIYNYEESIVQGCEFVIHPGSRAAGSALWSGGGLISIIDCHFIGVGSGAGFSGLSVTNFAATIRNNLFLDEEGRWATRIRLHESLTVGDPHFSIEFTGNLVWNKAGNIPETDFQLLINYTIPTVLFNNNTIVGTTVLFSLGGGVPITCNDLGKHQVAI
ncbi:MAG: hypothetical protein KJ970_10735 [Candidatus Eisenbacteria bacterium]|uniref:Right handed beta helix domain-containing protein n=1 Tax=Eiseniibacteriota bacterium TaxID=2212470 RepID=A0A948W6R1_UNCEI|nr:hypothetical protein [Candidatus Eisenbacteria bacterium]MBU1950212.1 hypothetical protein [Candidatus Eisenbacteria bacterium]MBU2691390.1 hypothetical protein [Candidatus Eisenbacteria bacterium]